ncbi:8037_t:CDS:2, partial [Funneliformis geosporum]
MLKKYGQLTLEIIESQALYYLVTKLQTYKFLSFNCMTWHYLQTFFSDFREERLTIFEQKIVYEKLHEFIKNEDNKDTDEDIGEHSDLEDEFQQENDTSDKKNDPLVSLLQNLKKRY